MANICLPKPETDEFKRALKDGRIDPEALSNMSPNARHEYLADIVGEEYATMVNAEFEEKLLLKNFKKGAIEWAKSTAGLTEERRTDIVNKINNLERVLSPKEGEAFLADLAEQKLGVGVTREEAKTILELSKKIEELKAFDGVKTTEDLVQMFDMLPKDTMTDEQKTSLESLKAKVEEIKNSQAIEEAKVQAEKQARTKIETEAREKMKAESAAKRKALNDEKAKAKSEASAKAKAERDALREETKQKKLEAKQDAQADKMLADYEAKRQKDIDAREFAEKSAIDRENAKKERTLQREIERQEREFERKTRREQEQFDRETERQRKKLERENFKQAIGENLRKLKKAFGNDLPDDIKQRMDDVAELRARRRTKEDFDAYGKAREELEHYTNSLSEQSIGEQFKRKPLQTAASTTKAMKAALDDSGIFRQGWKPLFTHPGEWLRDSAKTFSDFARTVKGDDILREVRAEILSDPEYDMAKTAKLAVGTREEAFPTGIPENIPGLGRLYKASEAAYTGFVYRLRMGIFKQYLNIARRSGVELTTEKLESIGRMVNSLTGRGHLGVAEPAADVVNNVFFSPRNIKSTFDTLTAHLLDPKVGRTEKIQSATNLLKIVAGIAGIMTIANLIHPGSAELDPRSANFGKIKVGDTRFDISGGMASLVTLAARLVPALWGKAATKNSSTGVVTKLNSGKFGSQTGLDVLGEYLQGKASPAFSVLLDVLRGQDFNGNKPTPLNEILNVTTPLGVTNFFELKNDPNAANIIVAMLADAFGIATNTYKPPKKKKK